ncbi:MAG: carboxypeptidase-like regulatory domain-containing protein [Candidatus Nanopelagicales bacterium]|nr:carboxypeptidase-like regulatory domain-containing protein [Candidatus Nanopelagicales bacterium]
MPGTTPSGTGTVTGTVTGEGRPLPFATVRLVPVATAEGAAPLPPLVTRTDGLGRYRFGQLPPTAAQLRAEAPPGSGLVDTSWPRAHTRAEAGVLRVAHGPVLADLDLPRGGTVAGQVVDADTGAPVPGAVVRATARAGWMVEEVGAAEGTGDGGFLITGLPPRPLRLAVRLPGTSPYLGPWFWTAEGQRAVLAIDGRAATDDVTIRLERGAEVRGTVRDDAGSPVAGALVGVRGCVIGCPVAVPTDERGSPPARRSSVSTSRCRAGPRSGCGCSTATARCPTWSCSCAPPRGRRTPAASGLGGTSGPAIRWTRPAGCWDRSPQGATTWSS